LIILESAGVEMFGILWPLGIVYDNLVKFVVFWYILWYLGTFSLVFGTLHHEKSGNPGPRQIGFKARKSEILKTATRCKYHSMFENNF
jgi:hypothetical protein